MSDFPDIDLLARVREKALDKNFPTPYCLTPGAVAYYLEYGDLLDSDEKHIEVCVYCRSMLENLAGRMRFSLEAGRSVLIDGVPAFSIIRAEPVPGANQPSPVQLDKLVKAIVRLLNFNEIEVRMALTPDPECPMSPTGKHLNTRGIGTFGVYECRFCHREMTE